MKYDDTPVHAMWIMTKINAMNGHMKANLSLPSATNVYLMTFVAILIDLLKISKIISAMNVRTAKIIPIHICLDALLINY